MIFKPSPLAGEGRVRGYLTFLIFFAFISVVSAGTLEPISPTPAVSSHSSIEDSMKAIEKNKDFVDISTFPGVLSDLRYASVNNFMGINMYGPLYGPKARVFLHKDAAAKL